MKFGKTFSIAICVLILTTVGCSEGPNYNEYLPYIVTKVGKTVMYEYVGTEAIPDNLRTLIGGKDGNGKECTFSSVSIGKPEGACNNLTNVRLGNVVYVSIGSFRENIYTSSYIDCPRCSNIDLELLSNKAREAFNNSDLGTVETKINTVALGVKILDQKVDSNMKQTVDAVKRVDDKVRATNTDLHEVVVEVQRHKKVIDEAQKAPQYERSSKPKPKEPEAITIQTNDNQFQFLDN